MLSFDIICILPSTHPTLIFVISYMKDEPPSFSVGRQKRYATSSHVQMTSFVHVCDVKSAEALYLFNNFKY